MHFKNQIRDGSELPMPTSFASFRRIVEIWSINEIWLVRDAKLLTSVMNKRTQIRSRSGFLSSKFCFDNESLKLQVLVGIFIANI